MEKPTLKTFIILYMMFWFALCIMFIVNGTSTFPFLSIAVANMVIICINVIGLIIVVATGWVPWRDDDV